MDAAEKLKYLENENAQLRKRVAELEAMLGQPSGGVARPEKAGDDLARPDVRESGGQATCAPNPFAKHGLSKEQIQRYSRQLLLPTFGAKGQAALCNSSVLVIGGGGLGSPAALYLAAAGVGKLGIVDKDVVELNNLHRQIVHSEATVGQHKALSAAATCRMLNSSIEVVAYTKAFNAKNALEIVSQYSVIVDATDNAASRYLINDACVVAGKPLVSGAAIGLDGQLTIYHYQDGPCYRCLYPQPPPAAVCQRCADAGVLGAVPGVIGCLQALEAIKLASGIGEPLAKRLLIFDAKAGRMQTVKLRNKVPDCAACGSAPSITAESLPNFDYEKFTGSQMTDQVPERQQQLPLNQTIDWLEYKKRAEAAEPHVLLDVREPHQFDIAALPGAINIPYDKLENRVSEVKDALRNREVGGAIAPPVYVLCRRGNDSQLAVEALRKAGVEAAYDLVGGLEAFAKAVDANFPTY